MMALDSRLHLKQTDYFIRQRPVEITVERRRREPDGRGGFRYVEPPTSLPPQTVRKIGSFRVGSTVERTTADGAIVVPSNAVIAYPDADIQRHDKFTIDDVVHEVVFVQVLPEWRLQAEVYEEQ
jgi:hypothetical protein